MKAILCAYSSLHYVDKPRWQVQLEENPSLSDFVFQDAFSPVNGGVDWSNREPNRILRENAALLGIHETVFDPSLPAEIDEPISSTVKDEWLLVRMDALIVDLCVPSFGDFHRSLFLAKVGGIPILGLSNRFVSSPQVYNSLTAMCNPQNSDQIGLILRGITNSVQTPEAPPMVFKGMNQPELGERQKAFLSNVLSTAKIPGK